MGVIVSRITKPVRAYNIENRAQKIINREKPIPAPRHPSTEEQVKIANEVDPNFMETHYKKDKELLDRLKQVFVSSHVQQDDTDIDKLEKALPHRQTATEEFEYGYWEPSQVPEGRCYLKHALQFMSDHLTNPEMNNAESIALKYKLNPKDVANILEYYRVFQVIVPKEGANRITVPKYEVKGEITDK